MNTSFVTCLIWLGVGTGLSRAQSSDTLRTLPALIEVALQKNPFVKEKALATDLARNDWFLARSKSLPQLQLQGSYTYYPTLPVSLLPGEALGAPGQFLPVRLNTPYQTSALLEVNQVVYSPVLSVVRQQAKQGEMLAQLSVEKVKEELVKDLSLVYYSAYLLRQQTELTIQNLRSTERLVAIARSNHQAGLVKTTDVDRVALILQQLQTALAAQQSAYRQQVNTLRLLAGLPAEFPLEVTPDLPEAWPEGISTDSARAGQGIDDRLVEARKTLNSLELKSIRASYLPSLQGFGQIGQLLFGRTLSGSFGEKSYSFQAVGLRLQAPVFDGMARTYKLRRNQIERLQLNYQQLFVRRSLETQQRNGLEKLLTSRSNLQPRQARVHLARQVYQQLYQSYQSGLIALSEVLLSEADLREAQREYINSLGEYLVALVEWKKASSNLLSPLH